MTYRRIKDIVAQAGTAFAFAFPGQSVYVESLPENEPQRFVPPTAP